VYMATHTGVGERLHFAVGKRQERARPGAPGSPFFWANPGHCAGLACIIHERTAGGPAYHPEGAPPKLVLLGWGSSVIFTLNAIPARSRLLLDAPGSDSFVQKIQLMPGNESKPASQLIICAMSCCSITDTCTASRAESRRYPRTISLARSTAA
jgi:hypothetical protein